MKKTGYMRMLWQMLLCFMIVVSCAKDDMKVSSMDMDVVSMAEIIPDDFDTVCPGDRCFVAVLFEEDEYDFWERPMSLSLEMTEGGQLQFFLERTGKSVLSCVIIQVAFPISLRLHCSTTAV